MEQDYVKKVLVQENLYRYYTRSLGIKYENIKALIVIILLHTAFKKQQKDQ